LAEINGLTIHGTKEAAKSVYTVSINMAGVDCGELSFMLDQAYGIQTRAGLHYNVPMKLGKISEILSEPDIIKDRKLSGKKVRENGEKKTIYS